jgi:hypothetical protein
MQKKSWQSCFKAERDLCHTSNSTELAIIFGEMTPNPLVVDNRPTMVQNGVLPGARSKNNVKHAGKCNKHSANLRNWRKTKGGK